MRDLFEKVSKAKSVQELDLIINHEPGISSIVKKFEVKYPDFERTVRSEEVDRLFAQGIINPDHTINLTGGYKFSTLEKLLLAILWKNGHITRIQSILDGITGVRKSKSNFGVIFRQFGRSLTDLEEPIVDQHVLRAFCEFADISEVKGRKRVPRKTAFKDSDEELIYVYRKWFKNILKEIPTDEKEKFKYRLDKILFAVGKHLE